jgi:hypothetical protein
MIPNIYEGFSYSPLKVPYPRNNKFPGDDSHFNNTSLTMMFYPSSDLS